jgi:hypothetical protein
MHIKVWSESLKGRKHFQDQGMYGKTTLKRVLEKQSMTKWTVFI